MYIVINAFSTEQSEQAAAEATSARLGHHLQTTGAHVHWTPLTDGGWYAACTLCGAGVSIDADLTAAGPALSERCAPGRR